MKQKPIVQKVLILASSLSLSAWFVAIQVLGADLDQEEISLRSATSKTVTSTSTLPDPIALLAYLAGLIFFAFAVKGARKRKWRINALWFGHAGLIFFTPAISNLMRSISFPHCCSGFSWADRERVENAGYLLSAFWIFLLLGLYYEIKKIPDSSESQQEATKPPAEK